MQAGSAMSDDIPTAGARRPEPLSVLWRAFSAPQTLMVLMGLIALSLALSTLIPQIPAQARQDPQAWLATQPGLLGQSNGLLLTLGLFDILHAFWFRLLLVLTGLALLVWVVESTEVAVRAAGRGQWDPDTLASWAGGAHPIHISSPLPPDTALTRLRSSLLQHGYRLAGVPEHLDTDLVASHRGYLLWARPVLFAALLTALLGLVVVETWGWQNQDWRPATGESRIVGHNTAYSLRLEEFGQGAGENGDPCDYASHISLLEDTTVVQTETVKSGKPASLQGMAVRQVGYVPAVRIRGKDEAGRPLMLQEAGEDSGIPGEVEIIFPTPEAQPLLFVASHDFYLALTFELPGDDGKPELRVDFLDGDGSERRTLQVLRESGTVRFDNSQLEVALAYRPILRVDHRPGVRLVVFGMVLAAISGMALWILPPHVVWFTLESAGEETTVVQVRTTASPGCSRWLPQLAGRIREVLSDDA
jgi:hypothetical protein